MVGWGDINSSIKYPYDLTIEHTLSYPTHESLQSRRMEFRIPYHSDKLTTSKPGSRDKVILPSGSIAKTAPLDPSIQDHSGSSAASGLNK